LEKYSRQGIPIHLPFEKLSYSDLHDFSLEGSLFFMSDMSGAFSIYNMIQDSQN
jgi:hypothetical protein